jgi:hypothetical protein
VQRSQIVDEWRAEGRKEGLEQGLAALRSSVLRVLRVRFGGALPADVQAAVEGQADLDELSRWVEAASTAAGIEQFRAAVLPFNGPPPA